MFLNCYYQVLVEEELLQAKMRNVAIWLSCYVYIFAILTYLTTVNQCLAIFFSKNYTSWEISLLEEAKKGIKTLEKEKRKKWQKLTPFFNK